MTSCIYDDESNTPQDYPDLMEVLGINEDNNLGQGELGLIEFDDIPSMIDPVDEPKLQYNIPEVTYNHAPFNSLTVHSNFPHPTPPDSPLTAQCAVQSFGSKIVRLYKLWPVCCPLATMQNTTDNTTVKSVILESSKSSSYHIRDPV